MKKIGMVIVLTVMFGCKKEDVTISADCVEKINPDVVCTTQYDPVCGCNNKTYGNACSAGAAGIRIAYTGECKK